MLFLFILFAIHIHICRTQFKSMTRKYISRFDSKMPNPKMKGINECLEFPISVSKLIMIYHRWVSKKRLDWAKRQPRRVLSNCRNTAGGDEVTFTIPELIGTENRASRPFQFARSPRAFNQKARAHPRWPLCWPSLNCNQILPGLICDGVSRDSADPRVRTNRFIH